ncbi:MAG: TIM barrel protein [Gammaproteobacteria bacterium]
MQNIVNQILEGNKTIKALMLESNLCAGAQPSTGRVAELRYGLSITDQCISWETTERSLSSMRKKLRYVLQGRKQAGERPPIAAGAIPMPPASRSQTRDRPVNVCTSTMPAFVLDDCLKLAANAGYQGVELRVHDNYHITLSQLISQCGQIKRIIETNRLDLRVYNTYYGVIDSDAVDALIHICKRTGVRYFRVTLPVAGKADVRTQAFEEAVVPSYRDRARPTEILRSVKASLQSLAKRAKAAGVSALVELHWGTVMSSFTSAHYLVGDLDPEAVAITFDPANMVIEGKEDWEYGIQLLREHVANVHIKNVSWLREGDSWKWYWDRLEQGMVDWPQLFCLLADADYRGMFAMEDFRVPRNFDEALAHLWELREETRFLLRQSELERDSSVIARQALSAAARLPLRAGERIHERAD